MAADFIAIDLSKLEYAGAIHDPVSAVLFAAPTSVDHSWVHGRRIVTDGKLATMELEPVIERHNSLARLLVS